MRLELRVSLWSGALNVAAVEATSGAGWAARSYRREGGGIRERATFGRAKFGTTKVCQIMPRHLKVRSHFLRCHLQLLACATGGTSPQFWYATPPTPPLPALRANLVAKGQQLLAIHMVAPPTWTPPPNRPSLNPPPPPLQCPPPWGPLLPGGGVAYKSEETSPPVACALPLCPTASRKRAEVGAEGIGHQFLNTTAKFGTNSRIVAQEQVRTVGGGWCLPWALRGLPTHPLGCGSPSVVGRRGGYNSDEITKVGGGGGGGC